MFGCNDYGSWFPFALLFLFGRNRFGGGFGGDFGGSNQRFIRPAPAPAPVINNYNTVFSPLPAPIVLPAPVVIPTPALTYSPTFVGALAPVRTFY